MKKIIFLVAVVAQISCKIQAQKIDGLSFVASRDSINETHVNPAKNTNANFVALMPFGSLSALNSPEIRFSENRQWFGETAHGVVQYASQFKRANLKIMLKPQLWVRRGDFTGYIAMTSEEDWKKLEQSYEKFILYHAATAKKIDADLFCIGTELEKFVTSRPEYWKELIKKIKKVYQGKLTYAANWDEFKRTPFWQQLDFIGIDAYFPLSDQQSPSIQELEMGWKPHKELMYSYYKKYNKPVLFTEFGYRSIDFMAKEPWLSNRVEGSVNLKNQENGLQAIHNQFWKEDWFAGGFIWKWFHRHDRVGGTTNNRFTPQNKPAEQLLIKLYGAK